MHRLLRTLLTIAFLITSPLATHAKIGTPPAPDSIPGQYVVKTRADVTQPRNAFDGDEFRYVEELPFGYHLVQQTREITSPESRLLELGAESAQPNFVKRIATTSFQGANAAV